MKPWQVYVALAASLPLLPAPLDPAPPAAAAVPKPV